MYCTQELRSRIHWRSIECASVVVAAAAADPCSVFDARHRQTISARIMLLAKLHVVAAAAASAAGRPNIQTVPSCRPRPLLSTGTVHARVCCTCAAANQPKCTNTHVRIPRADASSISIHIVRAINLNWRRCVCEKNTPIFPVRVFGCMCSTALGDLCVHGNCGASRAHKCRLGTDGHRNLFFASIVINVIIWRSCDIVYLSCRHNVSI